MNAKAFATQITEKSNSKFSMIGLHKSSAVPVTGFSSVSSVAKLLGFLLVSMLVCSNACAETHNLPPQGEDMIGAVRIMIAKPEDTLLDIARRFGLGYTEIVAANPGVDPWVPGAGTRVVVPTQFVLPPPPRRGLVLNLAQLRLFYFPTPKPGEPAQVMTFAVGIGTDYARTPLGETRITRKTVDPIWRPTQDIREEHAAEGRWLPAEVKAGPENPLGKHALYLALPGGYLIHGTNKPWGIGMRVSHGCIRMYPEGIEALYPQVPIGTPVRIIDERYLLGFRQRIPYLQVFPAVEEREEPNATLTPAVEMIVKGLPRSQAPDWNKTIATLTEQRGIPIPIAPSTPHLGQLLDAAPEVAETIPRSANANEPAR